MELRHLRYFIAVAEELHFGRAARRLNMSQPPLSKQIQELEQSVQATLLKRTHRSVSLTYAGRLFLEHARRIIEDAQELKDAAHRADQGEIGEFSIGFINSVGYSILPQIIRRFRESHPDVTLRVQELAGSYQADGLQRQRIDVGFARPRVFAPGIESEVVLVDPLVLAFPADHKNLPSRAVDLGTVRHENFINFSGTGSLGPDAPGFHEILYQLCGVAGFVPKVTHEARSIHTQLMLVRAGIGLAIVPASAMDIQPQSVRFRLLKNISLKTQIVLAWRRDNASPVLKPFIEATRWGARQTQQRRKSLFASM